VGGGEGDTSGIEPGFSGAEEIQGSGQTGRKSGSPICPRDGRGGEGHNRRKVAGSAVGEKKAGSAGGYEKGGRSGGRRGGRRRGRDGMWEGQSEKSFRVFLNDGSVLWLLLAMGSLGGQGRKAFPVDAGRDRRTLGPGRVQRILSEGLLGSEPFPVGGPVLAGKSR